MPKKATSKGRKPSKNRVADEQKGDANKIPPSKKASKSTSKNI